MKIPCPSCNKTLVLPDNAAGKKAKCPSCQTSFAVPQAVAVAVAKAPAAAPVAPPKPRSQPVPRADADRIQRAASTSTPRSVLPVDDDDGFVTEVVPSRRDQEPSEVAPDGLMYVFVGEDDVDFEPRLRKVLTDYIETEQMDLEIAKPELHPPQDLPPNTVLVHGEVTESDYGSQVLRWLLPGFACWFGLGNVRLGVTLEIENGAGKHDRFKARLRQWWGLFFGGFGNELMRRNVRIMTHKVASAVARLQTGRKFLNRRAYGCATTSLIMGIFGFIPFLGALLGPIGFFTGLVGFIVISKRRLPRGKVKSIFGMLLCLLATVANIGFMAYLIMHS